LVATVPPVVVFALVAAVAPVVVFVDAFARRLLEVAAALWLTTLGPCGLTCRAALLGRDVVTWCSANLFCVVPRAVVCDAVKLREVACGAVLRGVAAKCGAVRGAAKCPLAEKRGADIRGAEKCGAGADICGAEKPPPPPEKPPPPPPWGAAKPPPPPPPPWCCALAPVVMPAEARRIKMSAIGRMDTTSTSPCP